MSESKKPIDASEQYMGAWTPTNYASDYPPYVNVRQVGSMVKVTVRGDDQAIVSFIVNSWSFCELVKALKSASANFGKHS